LFRRYIPLRRNLLTPSGGHLRPAVYCRVTKWIEKHGLEAAEEIAKFEFDHLEVFANVVKKENIDCDFKLTRSFDIHTEPKWADAAKKEYLELKKAGIAKTTIDDIVFTYGEEAAKVCIFSIFTENDLTKFAGIWCQELYRMCRNQRRTNLAI
jgi:hypothetical protein